MEKIELSRADRIAILRKRDGPDCFLCKKPFRKDDKGKEVEEDITLDHWYPQSWAYAQGWSQDRVWHTDNLRLAHKPCNAKKGDLVPVDKKTVPTRVVTKAPSRAEKRAIRSEDCDLCMNGRTLLYGEECPECGSGPQPAIAPKAYQKSPKDCSHSGHDHCWMCFIGHIPRKSAVAVIAFGE